MKFKNINGQSYFMLPKPLVNPNNAGAALSLSGTTLGNKIIFYSGTMPTNDAFIDLTIANIEATAGVTKLLETTPFSITYGYDLITKKRTIKKSVVDATEMKYLNTGTVTFAAIVLTPLEGTKEYIIFTDSIGIWGQNNMPISVDNKNGTIGSSNLFKHLSLEINDISDNTIL